MDRAGAVAGAEAAPEQDRSRSVCLSCRAHLHRWLTPPPSPAPTHLPPPHAPAEQALGQTFSWAVFLGNGLMAIFAGFLGDYLVEKMGLGR